MRQLKASEVAAVRVAIHKKQLGHCPLCGVKMTAGQACLDHCHSAGHIRGVLCRNCNGIEGKIRNLVRRAKRGLAPEEYLSNLSAYWITHSVAQHALLHPSFRNAEQKRVLANAKARARRASAKAKSAK